MRTTICLLAIAMAMGAWAVSPARGADPALTNGVFAKSNLVAWCIVPFDTAKRGPQQRAEMLQRLGLRKFAYDWRDEHVPTFDEEIVQVQKHGIELSAFWGFREEIVPLLAKHKVKPQFWITVPSPAGANQAEQVEAAAKQLQWMADQTRELGCQLGLYNHGGWGGEPANLVAVAKRLRQGGKSDHVGIVYNFHHGHGHMQDFAEVLTAMQPYLLCINLNGMNDGAQPKILPIGSGQHEQAMMETIRRSGYAGPIGILGHREDMDAEVSLKQNLDGMKKVLQRMGDEAALKTYD
jgi:sugar phosphate isomerase/epimerase